MTGARIHYAWAVLAAGTLTVAGALGIARFGYTMVLPSMQQALGFDNTQAGGLATANLIGYSALAVLGGALASRFGPRIVITVGLTCAGLAMLFTATVDGFASAAAWRFITGMGSGASNVPVMGLMAAWFGARRRGLASGVAVAGSSIALIVLGPTVPRLIAAGGEAGWRVSWYVFGAATLALAALSYLVLRDRPSDVGLAPLGGDTRSTLDESRARAADDDLGPDPSSAGGPDPSSAGGSDQGSESAPVAGVDGQVVPPGTALRWGLVYRSPAVWHLGLVYVAFGFSYIIYMTFFTKYLVNEAGYSSADAGGLFMLMGWFSLLCGVIWGAVSDAIGRKWALVIVYLIQMTAFALFDLWAAPPGFLISAVLFGLTAWSIPAIMAAACGDALGSRLAPAALGFVTAFFALGQALAPTVAGALADSTGSFGSSFLLAAAVAFGGAVMAAFLRPAARSQAAEK
ncbi:MAG: MFS transporter [Thermoleophilia bacterium]